MISYKLKQIFLLSLVLIYAHGLEEVIGGFQHFDSFMVAGARYFGTTPEFFYWISHLIFWISLPTLFLIFRNKKPGLLLISIFGLIYFVELHHVIKGFIARSYYPGMITALFYPVVGLIFWKQLIKDWQAKKK